ncbi:MAG: CAP domain-containing protein [Microcoleaceae cyanobacterium]
MQQPSAQDQYMLELVNRGRLNPQAEANRYLNGNLNEGLAGGTISTAPKQPLAFNLDLNVAAKNHSQWMLNTNTFSHTGAGGTSSNQRMRNAGYDFAGSWGSGENIAWRGTTGTPNFTGYVGQIYQDLFVDQGISGRGHRKNLMNGSFQEVGISSLQGQFTTGNRTYNSVMTAQDFAYSSNGGPFLTGVAYTDAVTDDDFYTVGEGIGGIQITAVDLTNNSNTFTTTTWNSGGYSLDVAPNKTYRVTFSGDLDGDGQNDDTHVEQVNISGQNVKLDLATDELENSSTVPTPGDDNLTYTAANETINALGGNDTIRAAGGNDSVSGGNGRDHLLGQAGKDTLNGGADHDTLNGGSGNDLLLGQGGND